MNILIPMRIESSSTSVAMKRVAGKSVIELVLDSLRLQKDDTLWLVVNSSARNDILRISRSYHRVCDVKVVPVPFLTRGPVETIMSGVSRFSEEDLKKKIVCVDSDSLHDDDILTMFRRETENFLFYFKTDSSKYSHILLEEKTITDKTPQIKFIKEKDPLSSMGLTGAYAFKSAKLLSQACSAAIEKNILWLSELCQMMMHTESSTIFRACQVKHFFDLAVGVDREMYVAALLRGSQQEGGEEEKEGDRNFATKLRRPMKIAVSLESLLTKACDGDISSCAPVSSEIRKIQKLKAVGHQIIITTERTQDADITKTLEVGNLTMAQLRDFKIPFDKIYFNQPEYDVHITAADRAADLGIEFLNIAAPGDAVAPRSFNQVAFLSSNEVQKTSRTDILDGEVYFYQNIPADVARYFPKYLRSRETGIYTSLVMERVFGTPLTNLCITHCLGARHVRGLLGALKDLHTSADARMIAESTEKMKASVPNSAPLDVYCNYADKLRKRFSKHWQLYYDLLGEKQIRKIYHDIVQELMQFQKEDRALRSHCIHGDPVFSNVLDVGEGKITLLDMRGKLGDVLTIQGDAHYDLAKVLQCLYGYDFILQGNSVSKQDGDYLSELRAVYFDFLKKEYKTVLKRDVLWITASHYFSLVPLHKDQAKQKLYLELCCKVYAEAIEEKVSSS